MSVKSIDPLSGGSSPDNWLSSSPLRSAHNRETSGSSNENIEAVNAEEPIL